VADPDWDDPLDGRHAAERGGRWNPPESFPVVYLCRSIEVARANVYRRLEGQPYGPEDLRPEAGPILVRTRVPEDRFLNVITEAGCRDAGLPKTYPLDGRRRIVPHSRCQPIGLRAWEAGLPGVAARSARAAGEELGYFGRRKLRRGAVRSFDRWFWEPATA
jgi:RES domain-containing protein